MMRTLHVRSVNTLITIVPGYGIGKTYVVDSLETTPSLKIIHDPKKELHILDQALKTFRAELESMLHDPSAHDVLAFQYAMAMDEEFIQSIQSYIVDRQMNASYALRVALDYYVSVLSTSSNAYMRDRIDDFESFYERMLYVIQGIPFVDMRHIKEDIIVVLKTLNLHIMNQLNALHVKGIITSSKSITSHAAIIAKQKGIPSLFGVDDLDQFQHGELMILDADEKVIHMQPNTKMLASYAKSIDKDLLQPSQLTQWQTYPAKTMDGISIPIEANMSSIQDLDAIKASGAEGIGLIRTELLFIDKLLPPSFEDQLQTYERIVKHYKHHPITFRLFDLGGEKVVPFIRLKKEDNPLLGLRGIRLFQKYQQLFYNQIKALLMSAVHGHIRLLIPMVSTKKEIIEVMTYIKQVKQACIDKNIAVGDIQIGVMIEVPSLALSAHLIAPIVDFFSIGTNDLVQYTMATDRSVLLDNDIADPYHPSIISLIHHVSESAHKHHIPVSVCGDVASQEDYATLLVALGISSLSMVPSKILSMKQHISSIHSGHLKSLKPELLHIEDHQELKAILKKAPS